MSPRSVPRSALQNKVAIVTGGASGIGRALCEELARREAVVIVADLHGEEARGVAQRITDEGGRASAAQVDVARADSIRELVHDTLAKHGRIDLMFNNAGVGWTGDFKEMPLAHSERLVGINLNGVLGGASAVYPVMVKQGAGHIVNTSSFFSGLIPVPGKSVYSATKHAIVGFSLSLREEARAFGVNVSVVCPSFISTNIDENSAAILQGPTDAVARTARNRALDASSLAKAVLKGVSRNKAVIIMPAFIRPVWWLYRVSPWLLSVIHDRVLSRKVHRGETFSVAAIGLLPVRWLFRLLLQRRNP